jgi:F-type H+-transporting ATPase subunit a
MPEQLWVTHILNQVFGPAVTAFLQAIGIRPEHPQAPIHNALAMELVVFVFLIALFLLVRSRLSVDSPGGLQHTVEGLVSFVENQSGEIISSHTEEFTPFLMALGLFILCCNLIGLVPGFESPTAVPVVPLGCAVVAFLYYQAQGLKLSGTAYLKHFAGPSDSSMPLFVRLPLGILMVPIEIISHLARVLSLTVRLFANMFAGDMVTLVFFSLVPIGVPIAFLGLHIGVSLLQTYIFVLLTMVYLADAVPAEH